MSRRKNTTLQVGNVQWVLITAASFLVPFLVFLYLARPGAHVIVRSDSSAEQGYVAVPTDWPHTLNTSFLMGSVGVLGLYCGLLAGIAQARLAGKNDGDE